MAARTRAACLLLAMSLLSACVTSPAPGVRRELASELASSAGLSKTTLAAEGFVLLAYQRIGAPGQPLTVYIEGDGYAWKTRHLLSDDPTPTDPTALRLALQDPAANLVYLARPCQYVATEEVGRCTPDYWSGKRFAEEVIAATDVALELLRTRSQAPGLHLVGYSGGAAVAALVAARRNDVLSLRTVAGNLDHAALTALHGVTPLLGSLNPIDQAARLSALPQRHFVGGRDRVVPPGIAQGFLARLDSRRCAALDVVAQASHEEGWVENWPRLLALEVACNP
jgi:pimeloyl-ACP methyl ester carboxylesterase